MASEIETEFVVECLWPDVHEDDLRALDERAAEHAGRVARSGRAVSYLGSLLMREDEVVLCLFCGALEDVRLVARTAEIPYDRILEAAGSPWPIQSDRRNT